MRPATLRGLPAYANLGIMMVAGGRWILVCPAVFKAVDGYSDVPVVGSIPTCSRQNVLHAAERMIRIDPPLPPIVPAESLRGRGT